MKPRARSLSSAARPARARARRRPSRSTAGRYASVDRVRQAERLAARCAKSCASASTASRRSLHQLEAACGPARDSSSAATRGRRCRRAHARRAARCAAPAPGHRPRGSARRLGQSAATNASRCARREPRRPLDQLEPIGQEHADERPLIDLGHRGSRAVPSARTDFDPLRRQLQRDLVAMLRAAGLGRQRRTRHASAPKRTSSRSFEVRQDRPVQAK